MYQWFSRFDEGDGLVVFIVAAGLVALVAMFVAYMWRRVRESSDRAGLIRDMLERGLATEEITRVLLAAQMHGPEDDEQVDAEDDPEAYIVKCLTDRWYDGKDVERVLEAARAAGPIDPTTVRIIKSMSANRAGAKAIAKVLETRRQEHGPASEPAVAG